MKLPRSLTAIAATLVILAGCAKPVATHTDPAADEAAIRAVAAAWYAAQKAGDAAAKAELYAEDAVLYVPDSPPIKGRAAILDYNVKYFADPDNANLTDQMDSSAEFGVSGNLGWEAGLWSTTDASAAVVSKGNYISVYGRKDGKWQIIRDIWNAIEAEAPAAAPEATPPSS